MCVSRVSPVSRVLTYQPSSVRMPTVPSLDAPYLSSTLADYAVPFHHSTLASIPTDMQSRPTAFHHSTLASNPTDMQSRPSAALLPYGVAPLVLEMVQGGSS